jgi:hypothetical protein
MRQIKVWTDPGIADAFKAACIAAGVSMASELTSFMANRTAILSCVNEKSSIKLDTRGRRRKAVRSLISQLEMVCNEEYSYKERIPENLQNGAAFTNAEQSIELIEQAIDLLYEAF